MQTHTHGNGNGLNDLYILPESGNEAAALVAWLKQNEVAWHWSYSDVEGQPWYGRHFLEIPFGESLREMIERAMPPRSGSHVYEDGPRFATQDDPLTGTPAGHCIPGCIRADDPVTGRALLRVPVYHHKRADCATVYDLYRLVEEVI